MRRPPRETREPAPGGPAFATESDAIATILIVEDDVFILQLAEILIGDQGHDTLCACDVGEALVHLRADRHIDMLFTDVRLDSALLAGFDVARQGVALRPNLRVLYVSGSEMTNETNALFVERGRFLRKPYGEAELKRSIDAALH